MPIQQMLLGIDKGITGDQATFIGKVWNYTGGPTQVNASASGPGVSGGTDAINNGTSNANNTLFTWTCPADVSQVAILCVGAGGGGMGGGYQSVPIGPDDDIDYFYPGTGGGGGGLIYMNNYSVSAGTA